MRTHFILSYGRFVKDVVECFGGLSLQEMAQLGPSPLVLAGVGK